MAASCINLGDNAFGVVRPYPGQEQTFCGIGSCAAFREFLRNSLTPIRYSKIAITATVTAAAGVVVAAQAPVAFADWIDVTTGGSTGLPYTLTAADTNYFEFERPVPDTSDFLYCAVGMAAVAERPFLYTDGAKVFPSYIGESGDYREALREELYNNVSLQWNVGNNGCKYDIGRLCDFPSPNSPHGSDVLAPGVIARELGFTPFNAVLAIDSVKNQRRATITASVTHAFTLQPTSLTLPTGPETLYSPVSLSLFGFICSLPGARDFVMQPSSTPPSRPAIAAPQGWGR
jgi:hypothetical protein